MNTQYYTQVILRNIEYSFYFETKNKLMAKKQTTPPPNNWPNKTGNGNPSGRNRTQSPPKKKQG